MRTSFLLGQTSAQCTFLCQSASIALILKHTEFVASGGNRIQTKDLNWISRLSGIYVGTTRIDKRTNFTIRGTCNNHITRVQRTAIDEHGGYRASTLVKVGFDNKTRGRSIRVGLKLKHISLKKDGFEQVVNMQALLSRNINEHVLATPLFGDNTVFRKLLTNAIGRSPRLIDFVNRNNDRNIGSLSVIDSLNSLGHNAVICRNHQNNNVSYLSTASTHSSECFVTRSINEGDLTSVDINNRSTDVLSDAARLALGNASLTDCVKKRCFAVVNMTHNRNDRRTRQKVILRIVINDSKLFLRRNNANLATKVVRNKLNQIVAHGLRKGERRTEKEQALDNVIRRCIN